MLSAQPRLRLELGFHSGFIKSLATDSAERFLVTASDDKTVRVWDVASSRQLRVLRPPIGEGDVDEGKMYAAAIAPDGATIAAGGWTGPETHSIYIFDRASGRMLRRIPDLPGVTLHLAYSPDGRYLIAALSGAGVRLYRAPDYRQADADQYDADANWAAFSPAFAKDGLAATGSHDHFVRVYRILPAGKLQLLRKRKSERQEEPICLAFSPDGAKLAVSFGYDAYPVVEVWHPRTLARLYKIEDDQGGEATRIAWSADGRFLYVAGGLGFAGNEIARWEKGGRGDIEEVEVGDDENESRISGILPLRNGSLLFATSRPALGVVAADWTVARYEVAPIPGFLGLSLNNKFLLSADGMSLRFAYEQQAVAPAWFSVATRQLIVDETAPGLSGKPADDDSLEILGIGSIQIQLNRKLLKLLDGEVGQSVAVMPDTQAFVLATQWRLLRFDKQGKEQWQISLPVSAEAVNISGDGRFAVASLRDGTIRWYGTADGKERLAFFPHPDRQRWVRWTPEGHYDGAEDLIGFHTNRGEDQAAEFEPAARWREQFHRPDLVTKALQ